MKILLPTLLLYLCSCSSIQRYHNFDQQSGRIYTKYRGQKVVRMDKVEDLPNAWGNKDIYGGKVSKGSLLVYYGGVNNGKIKFLFHEQDVSTNASVFTRYLKNTAETREILPPDTFEIIINPKISKNLIHDYFELEILSWDESKITYKFTPKAATK